MHVTGMKRGMESESSGRSETTMLLIKQATGRKLGDCAGERLLRRRRSDSTMLLTKRAGRNRETDLVGVLRWIASDLAPAPATDFSHYNDLNCTIS